MSGFCFSRGCFNHHLGWAQANNLILSPHTIIKTHLLFYGRNGTTGDYFCLFVCLSVCMPSLCLSLFCLSAFCPSVCLSVFCLFVCLLCLSIFCQSVCLLSVYLSVCLLSICLYVCLSSVCMSVCPSLQIPHKYYEGTVLRNGNLYLTGQSFLGDINPDDPETLT